MAERELFPRTLHVDISLFLQAGPQRLRALLMFRCELAVCNRRFRTVGDLGRLHFLFGALLMIFGCFFWHSGIFHPVRLTHRFLGPAANRHSAAVWLIGGNSMKTRLFRKCGLYVRCGLATK